MVCLAPRALEDSVRPQPLSDVVVRPLNFTVSSHAWRQPLCFYQGWTAPVTCLHLS